MSDQKNFIRAKEGERTKNYVLQKKVQVTKTTTFVHCKIENGDKQNREDIIVYRSDNGKNGKGKPAGAKFIKILRCTESVSISFPRPSYKLSYLSNCRWFTLRLK